MVIEAYQYLTDISLQNTTSICNTDTARSISPNSGKISRKRQIPSDYDQIQHLPKSYRQNESENRLEEIEEIKIDEMNEIKIEYPDSGPELIEPENFAENQEKTAEAPIRAQTNFDVRVQKIKSSLPTENANAKMSYFESDRETKRHIIWRLYQAKDSSLTLEPNEVYRTCKEMKDLYPVYQKFFIDENKTEFWLCQTCQGISKIVYANEKSNKSNLVRHCKNNHKNKQKLVPILYPRKILPKKINPES